eukprot:16333002-Heterocapsa_arctica.AAC.1
MRMRRMRMRRILNFWDMVVSLFLFVNVDEDDEDDEDLKFLTFESLLDHCWITVGSLVDHL